MKNIAHYLKILPSINSTLFQLKPLDLINELDPCTILSYYFHKGVKVSSNIYIHCESTYYLKGVFLQCKHTQEEDGLVAIVSYGQDRTLQWKNMQRFTNESSGSKVSKVNNFSHRMVMNSNSIIV